MNNQYEFFVKLGLAGITEYFQEEQEESGNLEFKSGSCKINDLYKEVCAFANTDGGVIILGAPIEVVPNVDGRISHNERRKVCKGSLSFSKEDKTSDSIIQSFMTGVTPAISGIQVSKIDAFNGFVYIINIPQSPSSPHQVNGTYYMRAGTMSMPAPHGMVHALFNKRKPVKLTYNLIAEISSTFQLGFECNLILNVSNDTRQPAHKVEGLIGLLGNMMQKGEESQFKRSSTEGGKWYLTKSFQAPSALVKHLYWTQYFNKIVVHKEYFYVQLFLWANDSEAITVLYKILKDGSIIESDLSIKNESRIEMDAWLRSTPDDDL